MLKLKLQDFGHLMRRADSFEKTLMLRKIEGRRTWGWQKMRWLDDITDSVVMGLGELQQLGWTGRPGVLRFVGSRRVGHDWVTELNINVGNPRCIIINGLSNWGCLLVNQLKFQVFSCCSLFWEIPLPIDQSVLSGSLRRPERVIRVLIPWLCSMRSTCVKSVGSWLEKAQKVAGRDKCLVPNLLSRIITRPSGDWGTGYNLASESPSENEYSYPAWQANGSKKTRYMGCVYLSPMHVQSSPFQNFRQLGPHQS